MRLVKIESGLLEDPDFYINSSITEFLGDGEWIKENDYFKIIGGTIKRKFNYNQGFVIDVKKQNESFSGDNKFLFYLEHNGDHFGISEQEDSGISSEISFMRIIYYDGFLQAYISEDGIAFENIGGFRIDLEDEVLQCFSIEGNIPVAILDYRVYRNPYIEVQNFLPGTIVKLYSQDGNLIIEREFDGSHICRIFLESPVIGYLEFYYEEELLYTSNDIEFLPGDVFLNSESTIELLYNSELLDTIKSTFLKNFTDTFICKNNGADEVNGVILKIINSGSDTVEMSLDGDSYSGELYINKLEPYKEQEIYLRIIRNMEDSTFTVNSFYIEVREEVLSVG